ncbi:MAG: hypothetical protein LBL46_02655 [Rickettsiales bacterium]|nr:hypothetical protein [Rickettsiales bacterium]
MKKRIRESERFAFAENKRMEHKRGIFSYSLILLFSICGPAANAAGTYMGTGGYQSPQRYYNGGSASGGYYNRGGSGSTSFPSYNSGYADGGNYYNRGAAQQGRDMNYTRQQAQQQSRSASAAPGKDGFSFDGGLSMQWAQWNFDMKQTGSILDYSDIGWLVLDLKGKYKFGGWVVDGGLQFGMQNGESTMTDDDITRGGLLTEMYDEVNQQYYYSASQVLSIGQSKGGSLFGLNFGVGLADKLGFGRTKITPSIGYRMFNYKLTTQNNNGLAVATNFCMETDTGEQYCPAYILTSDGNGNLAITGETDDGWWQISPTDPYISTESYSVYQPNKTHIYNVSWNGPYLAADLDTQIDGHNAVNARVELGFPGYSAKGDQPYRPDWSHPTSVEDTKPIFGAIHLGLLANWTTMLNANWGLQFGFTYDYYKVSGANAKTYLNGDYYIAQLQAIFNAGVDSGAWTDDTAGEEQMYATSPEAQAIEAVYDACGGDSWTCTTKNEVNSFYRSVGLRLGVAGRF